jgi:curved DNA-binding protein CbpA
MNKRNIILDIIRSPEIKRILELKMATTSTVTRLIAEELMLNEGTDEDPNKISGQIKKLAAIKEKAPELEQYYNLVTSGNYDNAALDNIKKLHRTLSKKYHPDQNPDNSEAQGIFQVLTSLYVEKGDIEHVQQAIRILKGGGKQGQAVSQEVLKSVKEVIAKYEKGYLSFIKMIEDLKEDPALYYTNEKILQIYKNLGEILKEENELAQLKDEGSKKSFEKAAKALEVVKGKILQLLKNKIQAPKQDITESVLVEIKKSTQELQEGLQKLFEDTATPEEKAKRFEDDLYKIIQDKSVKPQKAKKAIEKMFTGRTGQKWIPSMSKGDQEQLIKLRRLACKIHNLNCDQYEKQQEKPAELVVKTKTGEIIPVKQGDPEKLVEIFDLIKNWIKIYKFIITKFAQEVKVLGGNPQKQLPSTALKLLGVKVDEIVPEVEKLLPVPIEPEQEPEEEAEAEPPTEEEPEQEKEEEETPELIDLKEDAIKEYIDAQDLFTTKFLSVKTLHDQSEIFRVFYGTVFPIAGVNPDKIIGQQISALTATANPDMKITKDEQEQTLGEAEEQEGKLSPQLTKNVASNAKLVERHSNAILEILGGYEKYLNIKKSSGKNRAGGVEQGSRELFDKFGESDPKKVLFKFVKLIVGDINGTISIIDKLIEQISKVYPDREETNENLTEAKVDTSVRDLPVREKILLVIKTANTVNPLSVRLKDKISKGSSSGDYRDSVEKEEDKAAKEKTATPTEVPTTEYLVREAPTMSSDATLNPNPTGTDGGPKDLETRDARKGNEIHQGYKEEAKKILDLLTKIRPLFPTSQPFDSEYGMDVALKSFKSALSGLNSFVAEIQGFEYDQVTNDRVLKGFKNKLEAFKVVIKDIFGFSEDTKDSKNQGAFSEEGENSGLPHPEQKGPGEEEEAGSVKEIQKKLKATLKDFKLTNYLVKMIMTNTYNDSDEEEASVPFGPLLTSSGGKVKTNITAFQSKNKMTSTIIKQEERKLQNVIAASATGNYSASIKKLTDSFITWLKRVVNSGSVNTLYEKKASDNVAKIRAVGQLMIDMLSSYYLMEEVDQKLAEKPQMSEQDIKAMNDIIEGYTKNAVLVRTKLGIFPVAKAGDKLDPKSKDFYGNFHQYKIPGFIATGKNKEEKGEEEETQDSLEPEEEEIAQELAGELVPRVSSDGNIMPKHEDSEGNLDVQSQDIESIVSQEIEEVAPEIKDDPEKLERITARIGEITTDKLKAEEPDKSLKDRMSDFLDETQSTVVEKFLQALVKQNIIKESGLAGVFKNLGDKEQIRLALQSLSPKEKETMQTIISDSDKRNKLLKLIGTVKKEDIIGKETEEGSPASDEKTEVIEIAQEEIERIKEEEPATPPEEAIKKAAEAIEAAVGDGTISLPQFEKEQEREKIAKEGFVSWGTQLKTHKTEIYKQAGISQDLLYIMRESPEPFPGFEKLEEIEQKAIAIFMAFISPDFDPDNIKEANTAEKTFEGLLGKYMNQDLVSRMIKIMKKRKVLDTFKRLFGDQATRDKINTYAEVFGVKKDSNAVDSVEEEIAEEAKEKLDKTPIKKIDILDLIDSVTAKVTEESPQFKALEAEKQKAKVAKEVAEIQKEKAEAETKAKIASYEAEYNAAKTMDDIKSLKNAIFSNKRFLTFMYASIKISERIAEGKDISAWNDFSKAVTDSTIESWKDEWFTTIKGSIEKYPTLSAQWEKLTEQEKELQEKEEKIQ